MRHNGHGKRPDHKYVASTFIGDCGTIMPIPRMRRQREKDHRKSMWCVKCGKKHRFREVRNGEFYMTLSGEAV